MEPLMSYAGAGSPATTVALAAFWFGYAMMVFVPGPSVVFIGTVATIRGRTGSLLVVAGVTAGSALLAVMMFVLVAAGLTGDRFQDAAKAVGAVLLLLVAWRILRARPPGIAFDTGGDTPLHRDVAFGFLCSFFNPMNAAYLLAFLLGGNLTALEESSAALAILGVVVIVTARSLLLVLLFSNAIVRSGVVKLFVPLRTSSAVALAAMGASELVPLLPTLL
jgi:threonine/homoserine/homoserine lactone efflux protein